MKQKIRGYFILITVISVLLATFAGVYLSYNTLVKQAVQMLEAEARVLAVNADAFPENIRVTLIDPQGTVLQDSGADYLLMDNHLNRQEIQKALSTGEGTAIRRSDTLSSTNIYYAVLLENGNILRLALVTDSIWALLGDALPVAVLLMLILIAVVVSLTGYLTRRIIRPMEESLLNAGAGDRLDPVYDELIPFATLLDEKNEEIKAKLKDLRRQKQQMDMITSNMNEGMLFVKTSGQIGFVNDAAFRLFGIEKADCQNKDLLYFSRDKALAEAILAASEGRSSFAHTESAGRKLYISANPVYHKWEQNGVIAVISDESERVRAEKIRKDFTANVSHELKTPLTSIIGYAELISAIDKQEDIHKFAGIIQRESQRLYMLISDVLRLSELESSGDILAERLELNELARECAESLELYAQSRNVQISVSGAECHVMSDRGLLSQLIRNLCDNAVRYNVDGGRVEIASGCDEARAWLKITDTGIGIPKDAQERIFVRFYRVDKLRSQIFVGSGLALALV